MNTLDSLTLWRLTRMFEVTYLTVNGRYNLPSRTLQEAKADVKRLEDLNKQPGHLATGIRIIEVK